MGWQQVQCSSLQHTWFHTTCWVNLVEIKTSQGFKFQENTRTWFAPGSHLVTHERTQSSSCPFDVITSWVHSFDIFLPWITKFINFEEPAGSHESNLQEPTWFPYCAVNLNPYTLKQDFPDLHGRSAKWVYLMIRYWVTSLLRFTPQVADNYRSHCPY